MQSGRRHACGQIRHRERCQDKRDRSRDHNGRANDWRTIQDPCKKRRDRRLETLPRRRKHHGFFVFCQSRGSAGRIGTLQRAVNARQGIDHMCRQAAESDVRLLVFPEALLGGYPRGSDFGTKVGSRSDSGRDLFRRYRDAAIVCPGSETEQLAALCDELHLHIVMGVIERDGGTPYCCSLIFVPGRGLVAKHHKLMPTGSERLIWGIGDGSTIPLVDTVTGRLGSAICWENYMSMHRQYLYATGLQVW